MMSQLQALEVLQAHRGERIVLTSMSAVGIWPTLSDTPLDFAHLPSSMGQTPALGLGLALACPDRGVIVVSGDGSLLMNLGCLVTMAQFVVPFYLLIMDNGLYEVTGGQPTAGAGHVDFPALAKAAGIPRTYTFTAVESWRTGAPEALTGPGPVVIVLQVEGRLGQHTPRAPRPMAQQIERLRQALCLS